MQYRFLIIVLALIFGACKNEKPSNDYKTLHNLPYLKKYDSTWKNLEKDSLQLIQTYFKKYVDTTWNQADMSGSILVAQHGKILFENYSGYANYEKKIPITAKTPIHVASVSKVFTATLILKFIDADSIKLEDKVNKYLPNFPYDSIRIQDLLTHRSGLPKYEYFTESDTVWDKKKALSNKDILTLLIKNKFPLQFKPNTKFTYCNTNYAILALIAEKVGKLPFPKLMNEMVFKPLGMKNSFVFQLQKDSLKVSQSYLKNWKIYKFNYLDAVYGDKNIYTTPRDLLLFDQATYREDFLSENLKEKVYKGYSYEDTGVKNYGLGIRLKEWPNGYKLIYHTGWWHGNNADYIHMPNQEATIIAMGNLFNKKVYGIENTVGIFADFPVYFDPYKNDHQNEQAELEAAEKMKIEQKKKEDSLLLLKKKIKAQKPSIPNKKIEVKDFDSI